MTADGGARARGRGPRAAGRRGAGALIRGVAALLLGAGALPFGAGALFAATPAAAAPGTVEELTVALPAGPGEDGEVQLDASLYLPVDVPAPAVVLAHGFGGSKAGLTEQAEELRALGYVVLTYSARGFGASTGEVSLDSLDHEVADARALVDLLAGRDEVLTSDGDPHVGVVGGSYGGALALMLGATDPRIDTVVAAATWNDLAGALVPNAVLPPGEPRPSTPAAVAYSQPGVFKQAWVSQLFGQAAGTGSGPCGRFTAELCAVYTDLVAGRPLSGDARALLAASSPAAVLNRMSAPTLLLQGTQDTLFELDHADANARQIAAAGAPVQVVWFAGGHDGAAGVDAFTATEETVTDWLATYLPVDGLPGPEVGTAGDPLPFTYPVPASSGRFAGDVEAAAYPGLVPSGDGVATTTVQVTGLPTPVANPPGGLPAAITSLPGLGALGGTGLGLDVPRPGQFALFVSEPLPESLTLVGSAEVRVQVARAPGGQFPEAGAATDAILFVALFDVDDAGRTLPGATVAPVRVDDLPTDGTPVDVTVALPATVWEFDAGHRVAVQVATTDALYQPSPAAAQYVVDASGPVTMPLVPGTARTTGGAASPAVLAGIAGVLLAGLVLLAVIRLRSRTSVRAAVGALPGTASPGTAPPAPGEAPPDDTGASASPAPAGRTAAPLVLTGLTKVYPRGLQAVDDLSFTVEHGQVLGLLGPNGAGKTTALRMAVGLLRPSAGSVRIFGEEVRPGADVLTRVGCFIEGPGFLPHLSGLRNLELYWAASGREPAAARIDEALTIAGLGEAVHRRVRGYSQGMRQRLAIAQAMLGMPELLILDEPTNGLDPPQIHDMRGVLARYAASGRTVVVSSHQLAEVERTCTHVVVMAAGRLVAAGTVAELAGESGEVTLEVSDASAAQAVLVALGIAEVMTLSATSVRVEPDGVPTESMVSALVVAGVGVRAVVHGRHLEETFLELVSE